MEIKKIELNPIEATSYWWVETIKKKLKEILSFEYNQEEKDFLLALYDFTDIEWRKLYLELIKCISCKVENLSYKEDDEYYHQATLKKCHNDVNEALRFVAGKKIPDIGLSPLNVEDSSIYTNKYGADRIYCLSGIVPLNTMYEPNYILSGDEVELEMKNLIMYLMELGLYDKSLETFKDIFCEFYCDLHKEYDRKLIEENFVRIINQINFSKEIRYSCLHSDCVDSKVLSKQKNK